MAAACDHLIRQKAGDHVSLITSVIHGEQVEPELHSLDEDDVAQRNQQLRDQGFGTQGYTVSAAAFLKQSETFMIVTPELNITRSDVYNYFNSQPSHPELTLFDWEADNWLMQPRRPDMSFSRSVAACYYKGVGQQGQMKQISGEDSFLTHNFEEFRALRDVVFWWKYVQCTDAHVFPRLRKWRYEHAQLNWELKSQGNVYNRQSNDPCFAIRALGTILTVRGKPNKEFNHAPEPSLSGLRWGSDASPNDERLGLGEHIENESDVLHIPKLPTFDGTLGQADAELLISFLTVPYLRMPLVVQFFASKNRLHALASEDIQRILTGVLLEPARCEPAQLRGKAPTHAPALAEEKAMLGTPYGALLNECARSPHLVPVAMRDLLTQVIQLGTQPFRCKTTTLILCVIGLYVHVESAVRFLLQLATSTHPSLSLDEIQGFEVSQNTRKQLEEHFAKSQALLAGEVRTVLLRWLHELEKETEVALRESPETVDRITRDQCSVHAFIILTLRNAPLTGRAAWADVQQMLTSFMFVERRHTWNGEEGLPVPEHQLFEIMHLRRREIVHWLNAQIKQCGSLHSANARKRRLSALQRLLHKVFVAGTGSEGYSTEWSAYQEPANRGRFAAKIKRLRRNAQGEIIPPALQEDIGFISERDLPVEVNLQLLQVTIRGEHVMALDEDIAMEDDVTMLFGEGCMTMQCAVLGNHENMRDRRLISHPFALQAWTPDEDLPFMAPGRLYKPSELAPSEQWLCDVFEPCRQEHFVKLRKGPLEWYFHNKDECLPESAQTALLIAFHPDQQKPWKEAVIFKAQRMVHVYMLVSHGRRHFRSLEYTSNATCTLHTLQPSTDDRKTAWARWARHEAMTDEFTESLKEYEPPPGDPSLVILRYRNRKTAAEVDHDAMTAERSINDQGAPSGGQLADDEATSVPETAEVEMPDDEWAPIEGSWCRPRTAEEEEEEAEEADLQGPLQDPPPADVVAMLRSREAKLSKTLALLEPVATSTTGKAAPILYRVTSVENHEEGVEGWMNPEKPVTVGLQDAVTKGRVQFEVMIVSLRHFDDGGKFRAGWVPPTFISQQDETRGDPHVSIAGEVPEEVGSKERMQQMYDSLQTPRPHGCEGDFDWFCALFDELRVKDVEDLIERAKDEGVTYKEAKNDASGSAVRMAFLLCGGDLSKLSICFPATDSDAKDEPAADDDHGSGGGSDDGDGSDGGDGSDTGDGSNTGDGSDAGDGSDDGMNSDDLHGSGSDSDDDDEQVKCAGNHDGDWAIDPRAKVYFSGGKELPWPEDADAKWAPSWADGDVLSVAADFETGAIQFAKNGERGSFPWICSARLLASRLP